MHDENILKANILAEALPYINQFAGKTMVVKYGGNAMLNDAVTKTILQDIAMLKIVGVNPILVHGGGPDINEMLKKLDIRSQFVNGLRVTDKDTMDVVQMVLCGKVNKNITASLNCLGVRAIGLSGLDGRLIQVKKKPVKDTDYGYVGEVTAINSKALTLLAKDEFIPVIATVGCDENGNSYNVNADTAAGEIAAAVDAERLLFLTDVDGITICDAGKKRFLNAVSASEIERYIEAGEITGGMIPKVRGCMKAIGKGVKKTHIINGTIPHPIMLELFTDKGIGTLVYSDEAL